MSAIPQLGSVSAQDIASQTIGWQSAIAAVSDRADAIRRSRDAWSPDHIVITGCGSPLFLGSTAAHLLTRVGGVHVPITMAPADELRRSPLIIAPSPENTLLLAISRSGATSELLDAVAEFRRAGGREVWAVTCRSESAIVPASDIAIAFDDGFEASVAQTRSFSSMLVAVGALAATLGGSDLAEASLLGAVGREAIDIATAKVASLDLGSAVTRIDFVGSGENYGLAREATLKMSEMALTSSAAYHVLEYRHGPISMTDEGSLLVALIDGDHEASERSVLLDVERFGGRTIAIDDSWWPAEAAALPTWARPVLRMPALQLLAHRRATSLDRDPDHPPHLSPVVFLGED